MASDPKRLELVFQHIRRIKAGEYPIIQGDSARGDYKIVERPFADLAEIDPGWITDAQRHRLIEAGPGTVR